MVKLTQYEQQMLAGEFGEFKRIALQNVVDYANVLGAEELCEVTKATVYLGAHPYLDIIDSDNYEEVFSEMMLCSDKVIPFGDFCAQCTCQTDTTPCDQYAHENTPADKKRFEKNISYLKTVCEHGVSIANSCTPYQTGWIPLMGEHFVTTESSNVLFSNSVFGACGNGNGLEATTWCAICGRAPLWGLHVKENRYGTHAYKIECASDTDIDWDIIGYTIGRFLPENAIPVITGDFKRPDMNKLKRCFACMATTSGAEMCHVVGITPEAMTFEMATNGKDIPVRVISQADYDESFNMICDKGCGDIQFVALGCPHFNLEEVKRAADYIRGKKVNPNVTFYIWTDLATKAMADASGYTKTIEDAGAILGNSSCPLVGGCESFRKSSGLVIDSGKQAHYLRSETNARMYYGSMEKCIDAAVSGRWEG